MTNRQIKIKLNRILNSPVKKEFIGIGLTKVFAVPATLFVSIVIARVLGSVDYGKYVFYLSIVNLTALLVCGGLTQLYTKEVSCSLQGHCYDEIRGAIQCGVIWTLLASCIVIAGLWLLVTTDAISSTDQDGELLLAVFIALPALCLSSIASGVLRGLGLGSRSQIPGLLIVPISQAILVALISYIHDLTIRGAVFVFVSANLIAILVSAFLIIRHMPPAVWSDPAKFRLAEWTKSVPVFTGIALLVFLNSQVGILILGFFSVPEQVAAYQIADRGAQCVLLAAAIFELVIAPHVARYFKANEIEKITNLFRIVRNAGFAITALVSLPFFIFSKELITLTFGAEYVKQAQPSLLILCSAVVIRASLGPASTLLTMTGGEGQVIAAHLVSLSLGATVTCLLASSMGATGAAIGSASALVIWSTILWWRSKQKFA